MIVTCVVGIVAGGCDFKQQQPGTTRAGVSGGLTQHGCSTGFEQQARGTSFTVVAGGSLVRQQLRAGTGRRQQHGADIAITGLAMVAKTCRATMIARSKYMPL